MAFFKSWWLTLISVLIAAVLLAVGISSVFDADDNSEAWGIAGIFYGLLTGVVLLAGLWLLRVGRSDTVAVALVTVGLVAFGLFWWAIFPPLVAAVVFFFGIMRGGLARELRRTAAV